MLEAEIEFENAKQKAEEEWSHSMIDAFEHAKTPQEKWTTYHKLTEKPKINTMLPLVTEDKPPAFKNEEKCEILHEVFFEGTHLRDVQFDNEFYENTSKNYSNLSENVNLTEDIEGFNDEIMFAEVEAAIELTMKGKSPGPDAFYAEFFQYGGENLIQAILYIFNLSWIKGILPSAWKEALVKFLRKHGKTDFYSPSSYRPISLTSTLCKIMERIILTRLEAFVEGKGLLDEEQEGFRRFHCTTYAVLKLVQDIKEGFNNGEATAVCSIDLEKTYDSVWREGVRVKLADMGINGRMWSWVKSFLSDRQVTCCIGSTIGQTHTSQTGLSQGSVLSLLLFDLFILD